ncbi:oxidoreductase YeiT [Iocasia frigidifontis]|uniref:dihydrouracil dehydrogenase (NAD(+)) n=2 Tax=Halanaerobiales TaxID=53433 RepID=A0A8A7K977_9FIRM|nr:oxidoreductase YeiT [Halocella sp. SP3-1]QTL97760.1 oxidoreductase YeiT [Iocasia fonsfrigidae]
MIEMRKLTFDLAEQEVARCLLCYDPPCTQACPANIDSASIIRSIRFENFPGAQAKYRKFGFLDKTCSELCFEQRNCEKACIRGRLDSPIKISSINNFLSNLELGILKKVNNDGS